MTIVSNDFICSQSDGWFRGDVLVSDYTELMSGGWWQEEHVAPFIFLPFITGSFTQYIVYPYYIEIYILDGEIYLLEDIITVYDNSSFLSDERWYQCLSYKDKYIGVRVNSLLMSSQYVTVPENRIKIHVFEPFYDVEVISNNINVTVIEAEQAIAASVGSKSEIAKVIEYFEARDFEFDNSNIQIAAGSRSEMLKVIEYFEARDFEIDSTEVSCSVGSKCELIIS